jgi:hypothetical protein
MTGQGWMVDDGTCDPCLDGECWRCLDTYEEGGDGEVIEVCCCNEQYVISRRPAGGGS